jgi:type IV secretion system protein VirB9
VTPLARQIIAIAVSVAGACWLAGHPTAAYAEAQAADQEAGGDARLRSVEYRPDLVLPLTGFVGYHIHIAFALGEKFVNLAAGDSAVLEIGAEANHLLLKAKLPTAGTNLTILTTRHVYFIDYRAFARAPKPNEATYSVEYRYADPAPLPGAVVAPTPAAPDPLQSRPAGRNQDYWFCGSPALRPIAASDDGIQLQLQFAAHAELPAIYARGADGAESLVNMDVENDTIVVHRLAPRFVLRRGRLAGCIVNRREESHARRAASGTVSEQVKRETTEVPP